ncbi:MAG: hypothetical protein J6C33_12115 [Lachnospiraceae bacterium]|nr:hypothetical protein [Lachnospiraceae bacterium]
MFKEALVGIFILFLFYLLCRFLWSRNKKLLSGLVFVLLTVSCAANIIYNAFVMFPDFYMDTVSGKFRYGTFRGNLFSYSDEFMFQDNILFPVLRNRTVLLDDTADFYKKFFSLYSKDCVSFTPPSADRETVILHKEDFDFSHEFSCIGIMDYVKEEIPDALTDSFEEEIYPYVYINTASLRGAEGLVVIMDEDYTLYVMSGAYYYEITGGNDNA